MHKHNLKNMKSICVSYYNSWANVDRLGVSIPVLLRTSREDGLKAVQRQTELNLAFRLHLIAMQRGLNCLFLTKLYFCQTVDKRKNKSKQDSLVPKYIT